MRKTSLSKTVKSSHMQVPEMDSVFHVTNYERSLQYAIGETEMKCQQNAIICSYIQTGLLKKNEMALHSSCLRCPTLECGVRSSVSNEEEIFSDVADLI